LFWYTKLQVYSLLTIPITIQLNLNCHKLTRGLKSDHIKRLITLTSGYIMRISLFIIYYVIVYYKTALSNPFATRHMWRMAFKMWRMALFPNTKILGYFGLNIRKKWRSFQISFNDHLKTSKQRVYIVMAQDVKFFIWSYKMWRMASFIRHNCGEHKNTVGHCCYKIICQNSWRSIFFAKKSDIIFTFSYRKKERGKYKIIPKYFFLFLICHFHVFVGFPQQRDSCIQCRMQILSWSECWTRHQRFRDVYVEN